MALKIENNKKNKQRELTIKYLVSLIDCTKMKTSISENSKKSKNWYQKLLKTYHISYSFTDLCYRHKIDFANHHAKWFSKKCMGYYWTSFYVITIKLILQIILTTQYDLCRNHRKNSMKLQIKLEIWYCQGKMVSAFLRFVRRVVHFVRWLLYFVIRKTYSYQLKLFKAEMISNIMIMLYWFLKYIS